MESSTSGLGDSPYHCIPRDGEERNARAGIKAGFHLRPPPPPHALDEFITEDGKLFETIHMGAAEVDLNRWQLVIDGLVQRPFACSFDQLQKLPSATVTTFHECYGSPLKPPTTALWRIGNVKWTGVRLKTLMEIAQPLAEARYVWSDGLDSGNFGGKYMDRYQKDLPIEKALSAEVLIAYQLNGEPLRRERGGPVRLVVPGFFGTCSTKWICRISLQRSRSPSPFTTVWYNEPNPIEPNGNPRPVWKVETNSIIVRPEPDVELDGSQVEVRGWAWSHDGIATVRISADGGESWTKASVKERVDFSWQEFTVTLKLPQGRRTLVSMATSLEGKSQPMTGRRNHVHKVPITVV